MFGGIIMDDNRFVANREHLYDETVDYDESNLPKELKEVVEEFEIKYGCR